MKLLSGALAFCVCALWGMEKSKRLSERYNTLAELQQIAGGLKEQLTVRRLSVKQGLAALPEGRGRSFCEALLESGVPSSQSRYWGLLKKEELKALREYLLNAGSWSLSELVYKSETLEGELDKRKQEALAESKGKGKLFRSLGIAAGAAAALLLI